MANDDFDRWIKLAEWRGETVRALEDIDNQLIEIKVDIKDIKKHNRERDWKTAYIAGSMAIIVSVITIILGFVIQNGIR